MSRDLTIDQIILGLKLHDTTVLAKTITLLESEKNEHREQSVRLLATLSKNKPKTTAFKIAISGTPGVGKSSFIEKFGLYLIDNQQAKVAVLTIDPSSQISGGSILGDKTRMNELSRRDGAYIRPTAAGNQLGGVARKTRDVLTLCEHFGFDYILVETVGVGQSEAAAWSMVDAFLMLMQTGGGDDLQGIKRGILELVDLMVITKADGDNEKKAVMYAQEMKTALGLLRGREIDVLTCSSLKNIGFSDVHSHLSILLNDKKQGESLEFAKKLYWAREYLMDEVSLRVLPELQRKLQANPNSSPEEIVQNILKTILKK